MWHDDNWMKENIAAVEDFDYSQIDSLKQFNGTHPKVMNERISKSNWSFHYDPNKVKLSLKDKLLLCIEKKFGWRVGEYKNYIVIP